MKYFLSLTLVVSLRSFSQPTPTERAQPIVEEGKLLYKCEMASWYGTDLFLEKHPDRNKIGGYFSYPDNGSTKCIFFSRDEIPTVIGTISFDSTFNIKTADVNLDSRVFSPTETDLYTIRRKALTEINDDTDLFKRFEKTSLNLIPLINNGEKKVYVLTGPKEQGVVIMGNDYLISFDNDNNLLSKKQLHKNILPFYFGKDDKQQVSAIHSHLPETGEFITATDICTLMLYSRFAKWETHQVVSAEYLNIWDCATNSLVVLPKSAAEKISADPKKSNKRKGK